MGLTSFFDRVKNPGASIGHNTATVKAFWVTVRRAPRDCPFDSKIVVDGLHLANPAAIIYECLTNSEWGMSGPASNIDTASFTAAAATLAAEKFGMALLWHRQESIEEFIGTVLNHIDASLALDPFTGKFRLKLIRADYDPDNLPVFGPHNATLKTFNRKAWGETINEVNVTWTNPVNEKEQTVTVHDTANINLQGGVTVSETMDFFGIRTAELALRVATRELQSMSTALATAELVANRVGWQVMPGDVIALAWDPYGFGSLPMRVTHVDYGKPGDSAVTLTLVEDVFGMPDQSYVSSDGSAWVNPAIDPEPLQHEHLVSAPYYSLVLRVGEAAAETVPDTSDYDLVFGTHEKTGIFSYDVMHEAPDANGDLGWVRRRTVMPAGRGALVNALVPETESLVTDLTGLANAEHFVAGALVWIGPVDQTGELALIKQVDQTGHTLTRGVLDTVPRAHPAGATIWALHAGVLGSTGVERALGETGTVRLLTNTNNGQLDIAAAANVTGAMSGRMHRPYRPANVQVNGVLWPDSETTQVFPATLTWAGRNRLNETTVLNRWADGSVTPEPGATFEVVLTAEDGNGALTVFRTEDVGTAETYTIDLAATPAPSGTAYIRARVDAKRDGLSNWQAVEHRLRLLAPPSNTTAEYVPVFAPENVQATVN